ncbi:MAG: hypothetical protein UHK60_08780 [Acutalibacteraceae bacterium]|nr:hypothetical protein [Acutalibacteraceae bacterium]
MNNNNNFDNNWGSVPNNNSDNTTETNQQNTDNFGQNNNEWNLGQQNNNNFNTINQNNFDSGWGMNQTPSNTSSHYDNSYTQNINPSGGFDSNVNYSNNTGFNPNQTYQNSLDGTSNNSNYSEPNMNFGYIPVDNSQINNNQIGNNQYNYGNQQVNNTQGVYENLGEDTIKSKATVSLVMGIISCLVAVVGIVLFWGSIAVACDVASGTTPETDSALFSIGAGVILSSILPLASLILGIIGIVIGAGYHKKSKLSGVYTNKGKATGGVVLSVIGSILSIIPVFTCLSCLSCATTLNLDDSDDYTYGDDYSYSEDFDDFDFDFDEYDLDDFDSDDYL